jgi:hypothetical protein
MGLSYQGRLKIALVIVTRIFESGKFRELFAPLKISEAQIQIAEGAGNGNAADMPLVAEGIDFFFQQRECTYDLAELTIHF